MAQDSSRCGYPGVGGAIGLVFLLLAGAMLGGLAVHLMGLQGRGPAELALTGAGPAVGVAAYAWYRRGDPSGTLRRFPSVDATFVLALTAALLGFEIVLYQAFATLTLVMPVPERLLEQMAQPPVDTLLLTSLLVVTAAAGEEVLFRGVILAGLLERYAPARAVLISAMIFGLAHFLPWAILTSGAGGLLLGWLYFRSRSVVLCTIVHVAHNLLSGIGLQRLGDLPGVAVWSERDPVAPLLPLWLFALGLLLAAAGFALADRRLRTR